MAQTESVSQQRIYASMIYMLTKVRNDDDLTFDARPRGKNSKWNINLSELAQFDSTGTLENLLRNNPQNPKTDAVYIESQHVYSSWQAADNEHIANIIADAIIAKAEHAANYRIY